MTSISMIDITESVKAKGENTTLLKFSAEGIQPLYAKEILATYLLMEWPLTGSDQETLRCYAMLLPHGKIHALEVFFLRQSDSMQGSLLGEYLGTTKTYSLIIPNNNYEGKMDEVISEMTWAKVCGYAKN